MRKTIISVFVIFILFGFIKNQEISLQLTGKVKSKSGYEFTNPKYSPNGKYILTSSTKHAGLYVLNSSDLSIKKAFLKNQNVGYGACWSEDNEHIYFRKKTGYIFHAYSLDVETGLVEKSDIDPQFLTTKGFNGETKSIAYIDANRQLVYLNSESKKTILTNDKNNYYHLVMNSGSINFVVHSGSKIYLINSLTAEVKVIGMGIANAISKDDRYVFYHLDSSSDGHHITNSELYAYDVQEEKTTQLTNTEMDIEVWGDISPNGEKLIYSNEKTGTVESVKINY